MFFAPLALIAFVITIVMLVLGGPRSGIQCPGKGVKEMFSIDSTALLDAAASIFNGLWPAFALVAGIALGAGLITTIVSEIRKAF